MPRHRPGTDRRHKRCDTKDKLIDRTWPGARFSEGSQPATCAHGLHHLQADRENTGYDIEAREIRARGGEGEAVRGIRYLVRVW